MFLKEHNEEGKSHKKIFKVRKCNMCFCNGETEYQRKENRKKKTEPQCLFTSS